MFIQCKYSKYKSLHQTYYLIFQYCLISRLTINVLSATNVFDMTKSRITFAHFGKEMARSKRYQSQHLMTQLFRRWVYIISREVNIRYTLTTFLEIVLNTMFSNMNQLGDIQYKEDLIKKLQPVERSSSLRIERPTSLAIRQHRRNSLPSPSVIKAIVHTPDLERVRSFSLTRDGLKNCGDKIRRRSTYSIATSEGPDSLSTGATSSLESICQRQQFKVAIIGSAGVGKKSLKNQFATSEELYINNKSK